MVGRFEEREKQDTRIPGKHGGKGLIDLQEERFAWQKPVTEADAFYKLPSTLSDGGIAFGSSTRADWESTVKSRRDGRNPYAGPGNYNVSGTATQTLPSPSSTMFAVAPRTPSECTSSPGPCYDLNGIYKDGKEKTGVGISFNKDDRKPMLINATDAVYHPRLSKASNGPVIGPGRHRRSFNTKTYSLASAPSPGPIYDVAKYDFRTGPQFSFGGFGGRRKVQDRFKGPSSCFA